MQEVLMFSLREARKNGFVGLKEMVEQYMITQKPYLRMNYSLEQLAEETGIRRHVLSAMINEEYCFGFNQFVNRYRVEEVKKRLRNNEIRRYTIEGIARDCGFNSRNTFIKNFKHITEQTPKEFMRSVFGSPECKN
jgi:AraC-like DNA-binding protein